MCPLCRLLLLITQLLLHFFVYFYVVCVTFIFDVYIQEYVLFLKSDFQQPCIIIISIKMPDIPLALLNHSLILDSLIFSNIFAIINSIENLNDILNSKYCDKHAHTCVCIHTHISTCIYPNIYFFKIHS